MNNQRAEERLFYRIQSGFSLLEHTRNVSEIELKNGVKKLE